MDFVEFNQCLIVKLLSKMMGKVLLFIRYNTHANALIVYVIGTILQENSCKFSN